ncbi:aminotransferase class IV [Epilithonimonas ginsengisoli]|uniref:Aminotransferase class IV n=1 Tax=Epilithonimonas ginsengisoli TaxID=1245592 RepID=A0ABU4JE74_9FLAO|nr:MULTISPECIES: aminotransferase class IV [Chryseobacterium group]MBV6879328.1 aminotransferase class IV [Epilithonimonas sp. FP105]MDW8547975.1 aminotransferase class IV [Epilithonimonas ginsengisoli]OAH73103.1 aminodeoxychorismate lyase [Chryseobacterium sp. FP211-J200]
MSRFIESIKVEDQKIFLTELHQKRMNETFSNFAKECKIDIQSLFLNLEHDEDGLYKFRIEYDLENNFKTQIVPYAISEHDDFGLVIDNEIDYTFKSADRTQFQKMKNDSSADEIIIVKENQITDTSYSNLLFLKDKTWFTPKTYLLNGVMRQSLLASKKIKETEITVDNIKEYSHFQLINALNDFDEMFIYPIEKIINLPKEESDLEF